MPDEPPRRRHSETPIYSQADLERIWKQREDSELLSELKTRTDKIGDAVKAHGGDDNRHLTLGQAKVLATVLGRERRQEVLFGTGRQLAVTIGAIVVVLSGLATVGTLIYHLATGK